MAPTLALDDNNSVDVSAFEFAFHYARYTYETLIAEPVNDKIKPLFGPPGSLQYPILLDLHLALGATHLACIHREPSYVEHAIRFQNRGLAKFQRMLQDFPRPEECLPMFAFSATLGILHFGLSRAPHSDGGISSPCINAFCEVGQLWRGSRSILSLAKQVLSEEQYADLFVDQVAAQEFIHGRPQNLQDATAEIEAEIDQIEELIDEECVGERRELLRGTLVVFRRISLYHSTSRPALLTAFCVAAPDGFMDLLRGANPHASIITGLYGALLNRLDDRWWSKGFGVDLMNEVSVGCNNERHADMHRRWRELAVHLASKGL